MRAIDAEKAIEIIESKQKELCPVGRYGRNYVYGSDREKYDAWDEIVDALENLPTLTPPNEPLSVLVNDEPDREYIDYICPRCKDIISQRRRGQRMETVYKCKFHDNCGQRVDWSDPQPYCRQPEGEEGA